MGLPFYDHDHDAEAYDVDYIIDDYREHKHDDELNDEFHLAATAGDHIDYHDHSPRTADHHEYNDCGPDE